MINIVSEDEFVILDILSNNDKSTESLILIYDIADGVQILNKNRISYIDISTVDDEISSLSKDNVIEILEYYKYLSKEIPTILVIKDFDKLVDDKNIEGLKILRQLKNIINLIKSGELLGNIILLTESLKSFPLIEKDNLILETDYPDREEIRSLLDNFLEKNSIHITNQLKTEFISALQGLTRSEIENLLYLSLSNNSELNQEDIDYIFNYKKQVVSKKGILEFIDLRKLPDDIGGLNNLKDWLNKKKRIFENLDEAINIGVGIPKGVLLFGMPGCGKSMASKYIAKLLKFPLLRLDMGKIMGPYLGQSEENMRKAIAVAEAISPSILWIDEIEKALSGVKGGGNNNDTLVRIFGTLLTWMQEKTKPVFVIATANDISILPPEFLRKGRFDEIFFVDFPSKSEIIDIFKVQLRMSKQNPENIDLNKVVEHLKKGYSGADVEAIVKQTVENVFLKGKNVVETEDLIKTIESGEIKPTEELLKDSIEELRKKISKIEARKAN